MAENVIDAIAGEEEAIPGAEEAAAAPAEEPAGEPEGAAAEAEAEAPKGEGTGEAPQKMVPLAALHEARDRSHDLQEQLRSTNDKMVRMETLFEQFQKETLGRARGEGAGDGEATIPTYEEDAEGHLRGTIDSLQQRLGAVEKEGGARKEAEKSQATEQGLLERYAGSVRAFSQETPDFQDAYDHLAKAIDQDLIARGYEDPAERKNVMDYEEGRMVGRALQGRKDPAKLIYDYAKSRGYKPQAEGEGEGDEDKLDRLKKGAKAAATLSGPKGQASTGTTLERLAELEGDEFDREWAKAQKQGLLG